jgi:hypothetical protein
VDPNAGTTVKFDYNYFEKFIFDKETATKEAEKIQNSKKEIDINEQKRNGTYLSSKTPTEISQMTNDELMNEVQKAADFQRSESTTPRNTFNQTLVESVQQNLTIEGLAVDKASSFLSTTQIKFSINGSPFILPPVIPGTDTPAFFEGLIKTEQGSKFINVQELWTFYLNYLENVYFDKTNQTVFKGGGTSPVSIFWGPNSTDNTDYYKKTWRYGMEETYDGYVAL